MCRKVWNLPREVEPVPAFSEEVLSEFEAPSTKCVAGAEFLLEELETHDPDLSERCGLLDNRHEVYVLRIYRCPRLVLVISLNTSRNKPWPCTVHGLVTKANRPCDAGRKKATRHFNLINPAWEPKNA